MCFSIDSVVSFENIRLKWFEEIKQYCPEVPFILVGTKLDIKLRKVSVQQGIDLAKQLGAVKYIECSALTKQGLKVVFDEVILCNIYGKNKIKQKSKCSIS